MSKNNDMEPWVARQWPSEAKRILECVAKEYGVAPDDILGKSKARVYSEPRQMCCYLMFAVLGMNTVDIAALVGRKYTVVIYSVKKISDLRGVYQGIERKYQRILKELADDVDN